jgi:predicted RNA polymerase sigma factor
LLYGGLWQFEPTPVVSLNAAVALAEAGDVARGLAIIEGLADHLSDYQPWHAARAALLAETGNHEEAATAYQRAIAMAPGPAEILFLQVRLVQISQLRMDK